MYRNGYRATRIVGVNENVVAPDNAVDDKTCLQQSADDLPAIGDRQSSSVHVSQPRLRDEFQEVHPRE